MTRKRFLGRKKVDIQIQGRVRHRVEGQGRRWGLACRGEARFACAVARAERRYILATYIRCRVMNALRGEMAETRMRQIPRERQRLPQGRTRWSREEGTLSTGGQYTEKGQSMAHGTSSARSRAAMQGRSNAICVPRCLEVRQGRP